MNEPEHDGYYWVYEDDGDEWVVAEVDADNKMVWFVGTYQQFGYECIAKWGPKIEPPLI